MKKKILILLTTIFAFAILTGCTRLTEEDINRVDYNMSTSEVEEILGKPNEQITDVAKITENAYADLRTLNKLNNMVANDDMERRIKELSKVHFVGSHDGNVKEYVYTVKNENGKRDVQIYFINGAVQYINRSEDED